MAHFYATIQGNRGQTSRTGTASSGIIADIASYSGAVHISLWQHENGKDYVTISLRPWHGHGIEKMLYQGTVNGETK